MADFKDKGDSGLSQWIDSELNAMVPDIHEFLLEQKVEKVPQNEDEFRKGLMATPVENRRQALLFGLFQEFMNQYGNLRRRDTYDIIEEDINRIKDSGQREIYGRYARANRQALIELDNADQLLQWWYIPQFGPKGPGRLLDKLGKVDFIVMDNDRSFKFLQPATTEFSAIGKKTELQRDYGEAFLLKPFIGVVTMLDENKQIAEDLPERIRTTLDETPGYGNLKGSIFKVFKKYDRK